MRILLSVITSLFLFVSCADNDQRRTVNRDENNQEQSALELKLKEVMTRIAALELFASSYTAGGPTSFSDCDSLTSASEKKICQIATAVSNNAALDVKSSLAEAAKGFQNTLYGNDCINGTDAGCPVIGSVMANVITIQASVATNSADIASLSTLLSTTRSAVDGLTTRMGSIESRLDNFDGTAFSVEIVVRGIKSDINVLQAEIAEIKGIIDPSRTTNQYLVCGDVAASGPVYELILISGDKTKIYGNVKSGSFFGNALVFKSGDTDVFTNTRLNTKTCNFKMFNNATNTKVQACWISTNRSATESQINAARTAGTTTCTPY